VVWPILAIVNIGVWFWLVLWNRDGVFPLFDLGSVCMAANVAYILIPLLGFVLSGLIFTSLSDLRLQFYSPSSKELGTFAWHYVVYVASFASVYLFVRGRASIRGLGFRPPDGRTIGAFVILAVFLSGVLTLVQAIYGFDLSPSYDSALYESYDVLQRLPLVVRQFVSRSQDALVIIRLGLLIILVANWRVRRWRYVLILLLSTSVLGYLFKMGARTELVVLFLGTGLLYHRLVRPLRVTVIVMAGIGVLVTAMVFGMMRGGTDIEGNVGNLRSLVSSYGTGELFSIANEFQTVFGGSYDLYQMKNAGAVQSVPWQVYATEILMLAPQQLLPFEKVLVQSWYLETSEVPSYFMYGPVSQAVLGLSWVELVLRGAILACVFGKVHRWYVRRAAGFQATLFYLWMTVWSYYTIRASTFYFVTLLVYGYIPTLVCVYLMRELLRVDHKEGEASVELAIAARPT